MISIIGHYGIKLSMISSLVFMINSINMVNSVVTSSWTSLINI